jgi:hypothetical protein
MGHIPNGDLSFRLCGIPFERCLGAAKAARAKAAGQQTGTPSSRKLCRRARGPEPIA